MGVVQRHLGPILHRGRISDTLQITTTSLMQATAVSALDWMFSINLKDAELHVPIHPASYKYLRLAVAPTEVYYFRALLFGLNTAPLVFSQIVGVHCQLPETVYSLHVHVYLNNWLFCHHH